MGGSFMMLNHDFRIGATLEVGVKKRDLNLFERVNEIGEDTGITMDVGHVNPYFLLFMDI